MTIILSSCSTTTGEQFFQTDIKAEKKTETRSNIEIISFLSFDSYYLENCVWLEDEATNDPAEFLVLLAESDALFKKCADRHNDLVFEIQKRIDMLTPKQ